MCTFENIDPGEKGVVSHRVRRRGKTTMSAVINSPRNGFPAVLAELAHRGRTPWRPPRRSLLPRLNGPTEATNGRLEALSRIALGFRHLDPTTECIHSYTAASSPQRIDAL